MPSAVQGGEALHFDGDDWRNIALPDNNREHYYRVWGTSAKMFLFSESWGEYTTIMEARNPMNIGKPVYLETSFWGTSNNNVFVAGSGGKISL